jgi:predicted nuclease of predicted toxin-antitoxin system
MKFKLDENMPADLATVLRQEGHDATDVEEEGMAGGEDPSVLQAATLEARVLLTFDTDFADIRQYPPGTHGGIVVFRLRDQRWQTLEGRVRRILARRNLQKLPQGLAVVDETRVRYRPPRE